MEIKMEKIRTWTAAVLAIAAALFAFTNFSIEGYLWDKEKDDVVTAKELEEKTSDAYIGRPAAEDVKTVTTKEEYDGLMGSVEVVSVKPKAVIATGVYSLGKWSEPYVKSRKRATKRKKAQVLTSTFLARIWGEYSQYYFIQLEDDSYILAQMNDCVADEIEKGEGLRIPLGHKIAYSQAAKNELDEMCQEYGADTNYVFYAIDDNWQKEHSFVLFISRVLAALASLIVVVIAATLLSGMFKRAGKRKNAV